MLKKIVVGLSMALAFFSAYGQSLEKLEEKDPVRISGGISSTGIGYHVTGIEGRRDPFTWYMNGNLNLSLYGWDIPFSFSYSDQNRSFRQPFNRYGIAPSYKWVKVYAGYHNLSYSSYTLAGHVFLGGAVELTPGNWHFSGMYGRLNKAVEEDTVRTIAGMPAYQRMGWGMKAGYGKDGNSLDLILFKAKDDPASIATPVKNEVLPEENLVVSLVGKKQLTERISLSAEYASTAYTRNILEDLQEGSSSSLVSVLGFLYNKRTSTQYYNAFNSSVGYAGNAYNLQLNYERIDPGYKTLGAYYFNNDLENITVSGSLRLLKDKLDVSANAGRQRNNLDDTEVSATKRFVSAVNLNYTPSQSWNFTGSYSNFTSFTNVRPRFDPFFENELDTLNFYQINRNATASAAYSFGNKDRRQSIFLNASFQTSDEESDGEQQNAASVFYSGNLAYRYNFTPKQVGVSVAVNTYKSEFAERESFTLGPNVSVNKSFLDKSLRSSLSTAYNFQQTDGEDPGKVLSMRFNTSFTPKAKKKEEGQADAKKSKKEEEEYSQLTTQPLPGELKQEEKEERKKIVKIGQDKGGFGQHSFSFNLIFLRKMSGLETQPTFNEYTATLTYAYRF